MLIEAAPPETPTDGGGREKFIGIGTDGGAVPYPDDWFPVYTDEPTVGGCP